MGKKAQILFIVSWYKTPTNPVAGTFFEEQARMFMNNGHKVGILVCNYQYKFLQNYRNLKFRNIKSWNDDGIETFYSSSQSITPKQKYPSKWDVRLFQITGYLKYREYLKKNGRPDIIHAHCSMWGGVLAKYISERENIPYFLTEHFSELILNKKYSNGLLPYKKMIEGVFENSIHSFAVSHFLMNELLNRFNIVSNNITVLPNILSSDLINKINLNGFISKSTFIIINIGNLIELKNQITLIKAVQIVNHNRIKVKLSIIGDGKLRSKLNQFIIDNRLEVSVRLVGQKSREEVFEELNNCNLLVSSSTFETFGMSLIEGLAFGKPVVALDSGGPRDIIADGDGILLNENTPETFAKAIETVMNDYDKYDQKGISKRCVDRFGEDKIYNQLYYYYKQIPLIGS